MSEEGIEMLPTDQLLLPFGVDFQRSRLSRHLSSRLQGTAAHNPQNMSAQSVWKSSNEEVVRLLCDKLDPLAKFPQDRLSKNLELLMTIVRKEPDWHVSHYAIACGFTHYLADVIQRDHEM